MNDGPRAARSARTARLAMRLSAAVAVVLIAAAPAGAQTADGTDDFRSQARVRTGLLYLTPSVTLDKLGVETNVFNTAEERGDFVVGATPRLDTWLPFGRRALLTTTFAGGVEWYRTFAGERSFNPDVRSRIEIPFRRVAAAVGGGRRRTRQRPQYEIDLRARRIVSEVNGAVAVEVSPPLSVVLEALRERTRFDGDARFAGTSLSETLNRDELAGIVSLRWRRTALSTFVFATEFRDVGFVQSPDRDSENWRFTVGGEFHPRALISGSGAIGLRRFVARGSAVTDVTRVVARGDLSYRLGDSTTLRFETERDIRYSFLRDDPFYVLNRTGLALIRRLGDRFDVTGGFVRDVYDYHDAGGRRLAVWRVSATVGRYLNPTTRIGFRVQYVTRDSALERWHFDGLEAGLVLDLDTPSAGLR